MKDIVFAFLFHKKQNLLSLHWLLFDFLVYSNNSCNHTFSLPFATCTFCTMGEIKNNIATTMLAEMPDISI